MVGPMRTLRAQRGVMQDQKLPNEIKCKAEDDILAGLVHAALHLTAGDAIVCVSEGKPCCTLDALYLAYARVKIASRSDSSILSRWYSTFHTCHKVYLEAELCQTASISYYTTFIPAGAYQWQGENLDTEYRSVVSDFDEKGNSVDQEVENTEWPRDI